MIEINKENCIGCGVCVSICPDGFEMEENKASVKNSRVPGINEAIETCPVDAIKI